MIPAVWAEEMKIYNHFQLILYVWIRLKCTLLALNLWATNLYSLVSGSFPNLMWCKIKWNKPAGACYGENRILIIRAMPGMPSFPGLRLVRQLSKNFFFPLEDIIEGLPKNNYFRRMILFQSTSSWKEKSL